MVTSVRPAAEARMVSSVAFLLPAVRSMAGYIAPQAVVMVSATWAA